MRDGYTIFINNLRDINKQLQYEFEQNKKKIKKHQNKFYWKAYHTIREKHFKEVRNYCKELLAVNEVVIGLINAYKIAEQNNIEPIHFFWEHKDFIATVRLQFKSLKGYKKYPKKHFLHENYDVCYERLRCKLINLINENKQYVKQENNISNHIITAAKTLGIAHNNINIDLIKKNYKIAAKKYHPDRGGSMEQMQKINEAYEILKEYCGGQCG